MNTSQRQGIPTSRVTGLLRRRWFQVLAVPVVGVIALAAWGKLGSTGTDPEIGSVFEVAQGPLAITITEAGTIQNRDLKIVPSELEGRAQILTLVAEGTVVEKGQLLVELDSSSLVDSQAQQQISTMNAEAAFIGARENLAVTKSQGESDVSKADLAYRFAQLDLKKYLEGDYPQALKQAQADIKIAAEELNRAEKQVNDSRELEKEGYITETELQGDELAATTKGLNLEMAKERLRLLEEYTKGRTEEELSSNVEQTEAALERTKRKASADMVQAEATLKAKKSEYDRQTEKLAKVEVQIGKCKIYAPSAGMVVYATTARPQRNVEPLAEGQEIRERQELIYLPTTASMRADIKIHESSLTKVKRGLPVRVTVDAVPGKMFTGKVGKIALLPDNQSMWMNPDLKVYNTEIWLDGDAEGLRAGMSCQADIGVAKYEDAVYVPVQAVVREQGKPCVYVVDGGGGPERREVEIGLDNNRMVHILSGLKKGETVTLKPPPSTAPDKEVQAGVTTAPGKEEAKPQTGQPAAGQGAEEKPAETTPTAGAGNGKEAEAAKSTLPDMSQFRTMTPEQQQKFIEGLTPEQKQELEKRRAARTPGRGGRGNRTGGAAGQDQGQ